MMEASSEYQQYFLIAVTSVALVIGVKQAKLLLSGNNRKKQRTKSNPKDMEARNEAEALLALEERKPSNLWNTAMFFPDYHADEPDSTTQQFLWYFQQARNSIRVCIYNFSFPELEYVICKQYERGQIVQFVIGQESSADNLRSREIPCGVFPKDPTIPYTDQLMHHKFAVIDDEAVLVGSMNWTTEGILNNNENICVSTNRIHVQKYAKEFFRLMSICENAKTFHLDYNVIYRFEKQIITINIEALFKTK